MRTLVLLISLSVLVFGNSVNAHMISETERESAFNQVGIAFGSWSGQVPAAVMRYLARKNPDVFQSVSRGNADACLSETTPAEKVDAACRATFRKIIETIRALLRSSYGLTKSMGRFDPTNVSYTKELTRSLLSLRPRGGG